MENATISLLDVENNEVYDVTVSQEDANRASTDVVFATTLLNAAKREQKITFNCTIDEVQDSLNKDDNTLNVTGIHIQDQVLNNDDNASRINENTTGNGSTEEDSESIYRWSHTYVILLLRTYQEQQHKFENGKMSHKKCWESVAKKMNTEGHKMTGPQCSSKLRSLKKTYRSIKDHNSRSGNDRRTWQYLEIMDEIFAKNVATEPLAVASSTGISLKRTENREADADLDIKCKQISCKITITLNINIGSKKHAKCNIEGMDNLLKKRIQQKEEEAVARNKRHQERMAMDAKLLEALTKFLEK
ncbi:heat shock 70 kda protein 14 [Holotrichia oblita]|uniref:Heat shock 70 kDa protein 14 n=1 Tax=Holotrichia oblita TaxID=644536 RepID=A0ACB9SQ00_HOLOL|nr:heat shock 70 kda protein 14 [Holotrichia oblita]